MNRYVAIPAHAPSYTALLRYARSRGILLPSPHPCCTSCRVPARGCCLISSCKSKGHDGTREDILQDRSRCYHTDCDMVQGTDRQHLCPWMTGRNLRPVHLPYGSRPDTIPRITCDEAIWLRTVVVVELEDVVQTQRHHIVDASSREVIIIISTGLVNRSS